MVSLPDGVLRSRRITRFAGVVRLLNMVLKLDMQAVVVVMSVRGGRMSEESEKLPPQSISEAVYEDERTLLVALREKIAAEIDKGVPAAYIAPVMRQLREIDKSIRTLDAAVEQEDSDDSKVEDTGFDAEAI